MSPPQSEPSKETRDAHRFRAEADTFPLDLKALSEYLASVGLNVDADTAVQQFATGLANINYRLFVVTRTA